MRVNAGAVAFAVLVRRDRRAAPAAALAHLAAGLSALAALIGSWVGIPYRYAITLACAAEVLILHLNLAHSTEPTQWQWRYLLPAIGFVLTERQPDYVVLGETKTHSFENITRAIRLIERGARFIATNPDPSGPSAEGSVPACGSFAALITQATGIRPYFVGKPNPLMMRSALNAIDAHSETAMMIGDRMDTDMVSGMEAGMRTILVLTGSTKEEDVERFPYRPTMVVKSIADVAELVGKLAPVETTA